MGLADDLKTLQELHHTGKLTDQEYATAKAATLKRPDIPSSASQSKYSWLLWVIGTVLVLGVSAAMVIWYGIGSQSTSRLIATAVHAPITLKDEVENLPASSWKAIGVTLPYNGTVDITLRVVRGNPVDVLVMSPDQLDTLKKEQWNDVQAYSEFTATKTETYRRTGQLSEGNYYLVVRDTSLGILSSSASDIALKMQLNP